MKKSNYLFNNIRTMSHNLNCVELNILLMLSDSNVWKDLKR